MASLTFIIEPDEVLGLSALVGLDKAADGGDPGTGTDADAVSKAKALMRRRPARRGRQILTAGRIPIPLLGTRRGRLHNGQAALMRSPPLDRS